MNIQGDKVIVSKSNEELFNFLTGMSNYEQLMPESIQKFEVDGDSFLFGLKGMPEIRLILKDKTAFSSVTLGAASSKLPFSLTADIQAKDTNKSEVQLTLDGDFNPMIAMKVKKPLTAFINALTENLSKL